MTQYDKAGPEDYGEVIDLANYVFSHEHVPHDFPAMLPKLYKRDVFMEAVHYVAREDGRIRAVVGGYPLEMEAGGGTVLGRGIGMVSVHPYYRSRGYMKVLMNMALEDMRRDGAVFSCLGGHRQRYAYFGFTPAGAAYTFTCSTDNITHTLGRDWKTGLTLKAVGPEDAALLDRIQALHEAKGLRFKRQRDRLFDILSSWQARIYAVLSAPDRVEGYFLDYHFYGANRLSEIVLEDLSRLPEALGLFLRQERRGEVEVSAGPQETEKLTALSRFAEHYSQGPAYQFAVFQYLPFIRPLLELKAQERPLRDGSFVLGIAGGPGLHFQSKGGKALVEETDRAADLSLPPLEALDFLFSPLAARIHPAIGNNLFLQSLLPLPLYIESADSV